MEPYVHDVRYRTAREIRARAAPHTRHLHEAIATRTESAGADGSRGGARSS
jgi:hypothetical protein